MGGDLRQELGMGQEGERAWEVQGLERVQESGGNKKRRHGSGRGQQHWRGQLDMA